MLMQSGLLCYLAWRSFTRQPIARPPLWGCKSSSRFYSTVRQLNSSYDENFLLRPIPSMPAQSMDHLWTPHVGIRSRCLHSLFFPSKRMLMIIVLTHLRFSSTVSRFPITGTTSTHTTNSPCVRRCCRWHSAPSMACSIWRAHRPSTQLLPRLCSPSTSLM